MKVYKVTVWGPDGEPTELGYFKTKSRARRELKETEKGINHKFMQDEYEILEVKVEE